MSIATDQNHDILARVTPATARTLDTLTTALDDTFMLLEPDSPDEEQALIAVAVWRQLKDIKQLVARLETRTERFALAAVRAQGRYIDVDDDTRYVVEQEPFGAARLVRDRPR